MINNKSLLICIIILSIFFLANITETPQNLELSNNSSANIAIIDTHNHLFGRINTPRGIEIIDYQGAAQIALEKMDSLGIEKMFIMPPPFYPEHPNMYDYHDFTDVIENYPDRFAFLGGGGTLNPMIQKAITEGHVTEELEQEFKIQAIGILNAGAIGFGEFAIEHLCLGPTHNHQEAPPDHSLFLVLADIAAQYNVPLDIHMEAVPQSLKLPANLSSPPNPSYLTPNIQALERLLEYNRQAKIIWVHIGWDQTGQRTAELTAQLLAKHPNLYVSIKICTKDSPLENCLLDNNGQITLAWLEVIQAYPDRFLIGSDQFYITPGLRTDFPPSVDDTIAVLDKLPPDLAKKIAYDNALNVFNLE